MSAERAYGVDLLTGAFQRERFEAELSRSVIDARKHGTPLSLVWIDVDELAEHNDIHGRDSLDAGLMWLASKLSKLVNGRGPLGRVEGGAFATFLPAISREEALVLCEQIRRVIPRTLHASSFGDYRLRVSVGIATLKSSEPWGNLIDAAETACRNAKQRGRDAVVAR